MKKIFLSALAVVCALSLTSCDDFLDSENYTEATTGNYPGSVNDLNALLSSLYFTMNQYCADPLQTPWFVWHIMSDEANGAGDDGDVECTAIGHLMSNKDDLFDLAWHCTYVGIARANSIIASIDACDWSGNESSRNQMLGEAYFMRGLFYLWGSQFWGDIPAYWEAAAPDPCPQQSAENVIYPHILSDFVSAMNLMTHNSATRAEGHATKISAEGYLARAYMFYEGFYKKAGELAAASPSAVQLYDQEGCSGTLSKQDVINALNDAKSSGECSLISDFRLLWQYTNEYTAPDYAYVKDLADRGDFWAGNGNAEQVFDVKFANVATWNTTYTTGYMNMTSLYSSLRCNEDASGHANGGKETFPFAQGWGQGVMDENLWNNWPEGDMRRQATILNANDGGEMEDIANSNPYKSYYTVYSWDEETHVAKIDDDGNYVVDEEYNGAYTAVCYATGICEETGYYNKKWMAYTCYQESLDIYEKGYYEGDGSEDNPYTYEYEHCPIFSTSSDPYTWWGVYRDNCGYTNTNGSSFQGDHFNDIILMRYADILLMLTELTGNAGDGMDEVRSRAGLSSVGYSWDNIKKERSYEFAGEGVRFNDLRRWSGIDGGTGCEAATALQAQAGTTIYYGGKNAKSYKHLESGWDQRYAATNGFLKIPPTQISVVADESVLKQNKGWSSGEGTTTGKLSY